MGFAGYPTSSNLCEGGTSAGGFYELDETADKDEQYKNACVIGVRYFRDNIILHQRGYEKQHGRVCRHCDTNKHACADGERFVMVERVNADSDQPLSIHVVLNWYEEFREREQD